MAYTKFDAKTFKVQIKDPVATPETFVDITGLTSIGWSESRDEIETTSDNARYKAYIYGDREFSVECEGFMVIDSTTFARDAGQRLVEQAARIDGVSGIRTFKIVYRDSPTTNYIQVEGYVTLGDMGGSRNDATPWSFTVRPNSDPVFNGPVFNPEDAVYD